uniref:cAMP responsive element modulator b n=4 Tax=Cyprinus carpio TaxID=7962 RepID=A0A9J8AF11_CYPCA
MWCFWMTDTVSVNQSSSAQFIPCQQRSETLTSRPGSPIMQYAVHSSNGTYIVSEKKGQATTGGMSAYQISSPISGLSQAMDGSPGSLPSPQQLTEEASQKRELRLMKNREAARECRRKKKEYVKCLENRVAVLEKQNKMLIEELKALKDIYCHKTE